jgi:DNA primase large subunit
LSIPYELVQRYPWLPSKNDYYSDIASREPTEFVKEVLIKYSNGELEARTFDIFKSAFQNLEEIQDYRDDELNVYLYTIIKILLYILNNKLIANRIANIYSKHSYKLLENESDYNIYEICKDLDIKFQYYEKPIEYKLIIDKNFTSSKKTHFSLYYIDYLKLASGLRDEERKLLHNALEKGQVYLRKKELSRLLQEQIRKKLIIEEDTDVASIEAFKKKLLKIKEIDDLYENILNEWELKKEDFEYSFELQTYHGKDLKESFPPCVKEVFRKIDEGQNVIHIERLFLVFYLHALQFSINDIVNLFTKLPDFDRKQTEYQVEFAKKKGYSPHSCSTLKSLGLCKAKEYNDNLCLEGYHSKKYDEQRKIQHPLFYLQMKQYQKFKPKVKQKGDKKINAD